MVLPERSALLVLAASSLVSSSISSVMMLSLSMSSECSSATDRCWWLLVEGAWRGDALEDAMTNDVSLRSVSQP